MKQNHTALAGLVFAGAPAIIVWLKMPVLAFVGLWVLSLIWWRHRPVSLQWPRRDHIRPIIVRAVGVALILGVGLFLFRPEQMFAFPLAMPERYVLVMLIYPFLSALPQEIVFRPLFWSWFSHLSPKGRIVWNALAFGVAHSIFMNPVAVVLSTVGGVILAYQYERHRDVVLVWIEHVLYGWLIFTLGWGTYFFHGTISMVGG
ncbi:MAG: CPBP family intramembrane glutamic endopeptidase [Alphaproteobacteria bacterium]